MGLLSVEFDRLVPSNGWGAWVRCGVCRDHSLDRRSDRRADLLGRLLYWPGRGFDWKPFIKYPYRQEGLRRAEMSSPEHWDVVAFRGNLEGPLVAKCRNGHELRVSQERMAQLPVSLDGVLYLPGN